MCDEAEARVASASSNQVNSMLLCMRGSLVHSPMSNTDILRSNVEGVHETVLLLPEIQLLIDRVHESKRVVEYGSMIGVIVCWV